MEKNLKASRPSENQLAKIAKDSAHQIWLAGVGALEKAQQEGSKLFESLVKEGEEIEARTQESAEKKVEEIKTSDRWDKLEQVFEDRVARALNRLSAPTHDDIMELSRRVDELNGRIKTLIEPKKPATRSRRTKPTQTTTQAPNTEDV